MDDWETLEIELPEEVENTPYEEPKVICDICKQEFPIQNSLTQHKKSCLPGTQVFREILGGKLEIDEQGFKSFLEKNKWDILIKAWIIDTLKSKHALDTGKISNPVNANNTECYVQEQSYFIPWITTQLYLKFLGRNTIIDGLSGFSENTAKSMEKVKNVLMRNGENIHHDKFPIWNGWRKYLNNNFNLGKFSAMNLEPIRIYINVYVKPEKKVHTPKDLEIKKQKTQLAEEIKALVKTSNFLKESVDELLLLKEKILYQFSLFEELQIEKPEKPYFEEYFQDFNSFKKNIDIHKEFFKTYLIDNVLTISSFQTLINEFKKLTPTPYFPIVNQLEKKFVEFNTNSSPKDKKQMLINLRRIINTGQKIKGENLFISLIEFNVFKNILDYLESN